MAKRFNAPSARKPKGTAPRTGKLPLLERLNGRIAASPNLYFAFVLLIAVVFSLILFDVKISEGNDDSMYIESGYFFSRDFTGYFTANAPLYPMLLSLPIRLFGVNLVLLKFLSFFFGLLHLVVFYMAFRKRIPYIVIFPVLILLAVNPYYLYFFSQTYTETFYMLLQMLLVWSILVLVAGETDSGSLGQSWKKWLVFGLMFLLLSLCKNIAIAAIPALLLYFLFEKKYKPIGLMAVSIALFRGGFELIRRGVWTHSDQFASQTAILLQKDPYDPSKGQESVSGFIDRFFGNIDLYISKRMYQILGFRGADDFTVNSALSLITIVVLAWAFFLVIRKRHKVLLITGLYALCMTGVTFLVLQTRWDQPRYFIVYLQFFLLILFYALYLGLNKAGFWKPRLYLLGIGILVGSSLIAAGRKGSANISTLKKNLQGDIFYGFTPDFVNYLKLSRWCADSLPSDA